MRSTYDILGNHIRLIDERNSELITTQVLGINIDKFFMPSVANVIGTDLGKYKLLSKGQFACNPMHVGRDERLPIALYEDDAAAIVSPAYFVFEIINTEALDPAFLMMWFRRAEFDRICWYHTDGSVRGGITWEDICRLEVPILDIDEQKNIVRAYKIISNRIELKRRINRNLEETIKAMYRRLSSEAIGDKITITIGDYCKVFTGKKDVNQAIPDGKNKFYSCSPTPAYSNDAIYTGKAILVAGNGSYTGRTIYVDEAFDLYQRTYALTPFDPEGCEVFLIYAAMQTDFQNQLHSKLHGSAIPYIVYGDLANFSFEIETNYTKTANKIGLLLYKIIENNNEIEILVKLEGVITSSISSR